MDELVTELAMNLGSSYLIIVIICQMQVLKIITTLHGGN